jgi:hypothetical protein
MTLLVEVEAQQVLRGGRWVSLQCYGSRCSTASTGYTVGDKCVRVCVLTVRGGGPRRILHPRASASVLPKKPCGQGQGPGSRYRAQMPGLV